MRINLSNRVSIEWLEGRQLFNGYYVSTTGSDSAAGTAAAPWKTLQHAADSVKAGDTVNVAAGNYAGFSEYGLKGTSSAHITFKADPGVNIVSKAPNETAVDCGIELSGYDASSGSAYVDLYGFNVNDSSGTIKGQVSSGIRVRYSNNIGIYNCTASNNGWVGIYCAYVSNITIDGCESFGNNLFVDSSTQRNHGIYVANSSSNVTIRNCIVHDNNGNGIHMNGDGGVNTGFLLEGNIIYNNGTLGGSAINCDGLQKSTLRNNLLYNNKNKGIALYNIDATGGSANNIIVNNTVVMGTVSGNAAIQIKDDATGNTVTNNIFINLGTGTALELYSSAAANTKIDYNIYGGPSKMMSGDGSLMTFANWRSGNPSYDAHSTTSTASAVFVDYANNNYHLLSTSPAVDTGTATNAPTTDQDLVARPQGAGYDIGAYEYSTGSGGVTIPADPTNLSATATAWNTIHLAWTDNSNNETGFYVYRKLGSTGTFAQVATVGAGITTYDDTGLSGNSTYYYKIVAYNSAGTSTNSTNTDSALTPAQPTAPIAPGNAVATATAYNSVTVTWTDNSTDETGFKVERATGTGAFSQIGTVGAGVATYTDTTAAGSTQYTYRVRATNAAGDSAYATSAAVTTPAAPTAPNAPANVAASAVSSTEVDLSWTDMSSNETGFTIQRKIGSGSWTALTTVNANITSYQDTTAAASTQYTYRVKATNSVGSSAFTTSSAVTTPAAPTAPAAPSGLMATSSGTDSIDLSWTDNSNNETGFKIERSTGGGSFTQIGTVGAGVTTFSDSGLTAATQYTYQVRATNDVGDSAYSATASATTDSVPTVPADPSALAASATSASQINLTWTDNSTNETGFRIERSLDGSTGWSQVGTVAKNVTTYNDTGLSASTQYFYRVVATNSVGDSGYPAAANATTQALPTVPIAPTNLVATPASTSEIDLAWSDNSSDETGFKVERSINGSTWTEIGTVGAGVTSYQSTGLSAGTTYYFRVRATNVAGDSDYSNTDIAATQANPVDTTAPTASASFSNISAAGDGSYSFTVTYTDDTSIDDTLLDNDDVLVTGPNGYSQRATFVSATMSNGGKTAVATYKITAPDATWSWQDDGTYTFALRDQEVADDAGNFVAPTTLGSMTSAVPSVDYAGNSRADARYLGVITSGKNATPSDTVEELDIQDYYRVRISTTSILTAKLYNMTADANLQLRAADGTLISTSGRSGTSYDYISKTLKAGTYYYRVINNGTPGTNYALRVAIGTPTAGSGALTGPDYAGNTRSTARKVGSFTSGRVSVYTDLVSPTDIQDYYRFDMAAAGTLSAKLTNLTGDVNMQLLDSTGHLIQISGNTGTADEYISRQLAAGTYYLRLYTLGGNGTNYRLRMAAA